SPADHIGPAGGVDPPRFQRGIHQRAVPVGTAFTQTHCRAGRGQDSVSNGVKTMSDQFELYAEVREDLGKGASRRLRRLGDRVPAIIYGGSKDPQPLSLIRKDLEKALENEAFFSHVLAINVAGKKEKAILRDLQRHPARNSVTHADFLRV